MRINDTQVYAIARIIQATWPEARRHDVIDAAILSASALEQAGEAA